VVGRSLKLEPPTTASLPAGFCPGPPAKAPNRRASGFSYGFRSTFRDWAAEQTNHQNHVVEMALAHTIGDKVEAAYRRGDLLQKRRELMEDWARYCG
jgi:integrase